MCRLVAILTIVTLGSCDTTALAPLDGPISSKGVEEFRFGLPATEIRQILGTSLSAGIADDFTTGHSWYYGLIREGPYEGIGVGTLDSAPDTTFADRPIDLLLITSPYDGKTHHGIGVGSDRTTVEQHLGQVKDTLSDNRPGRDSFKLLYCFEGRNFEGWYRSDTLYAIRLGFHYMPRHPDVYSCS